MRLQVVSDIDSDFLRKIVHDFLRWSRGTLAVPWHAVPPSELDMLRAWWRAPRDLSPSSQRFTLWQLAHATVKADTARHLPSFSVVRRVLGFLMEWSAALTSAHGNLRFDASEYADFVKTALTGRVAQGLALLYCQDQGYIYISHYSQFLSGNNRARSKGPDFVLEKRGGCLRALLEAKGTVASAHRSANVRPALRKAKGQLETGFKQLSGQVAEGYATLALLRGLDDTRDSEGFVTRIRNTSEEPPKPTHPREDLVTRGNYGVWLDFLGLTSLARGLLEPEVKQDIPESTVRVSEFGGKSIGFVALTPILRGISPVLRMSPTDLLLATPSTAEQPILVGGLGLSSLELIARVARERTSLSAKELPATEMQTLEFGECVISMFPDGSALGIVPWSTLEKAERKNV
ncbi:MAG: hypothetical protein KatS3mg121_1311 [Gammaproteobacteria bacterium]|nr:MAG: hypothetical protein KatS3mg121_1311 [Gammaproteobacteria bacterium]